METNLFGLLMEDAVRELFKKGYNREETYKTLSSRGPISKSAVYITSIKLHKNMKTKGDSSIDRYIFNKCLKFPDFAEIYWSKYPTEIKKDNVYRLLSGIYELREDLLTEFKKDTNESGIMVVNKLLRKTEEYLKVEEILAGMDSDEEIEINDKIGHIGFLNRGLEILKQEGKL